MIRAEYEAREQGKTVTDIAIECGVSTSLVSRTIRGKAKPYPKLRDGIAKALEWDGNPAELFEEIEVR